MAVTLQFSRNTKVYLEIGSDIWEIPVMDGFSFSQATNGADITLSEAASASGVSRRAKQTFTDSLAPSEWSFSTYMRPNPGASGAAGLGCVEEALWAQFIADNSYTTVSGEFGKGVDKSVANTTLFDFADSNVTTLGTYNLWFILGACGDNDGNYTGAEAAYTIYKIGGSVGNTATIDFDIEGIATIQWSGFGGEITEEANFDASSAITTGIGVDTNFIRNKLTALTIATTAGMQAAPHNFLAAYTSVLTAGQITFENNITFLTPETLCTINKPLGHVTGTRTVSGNFTAYLDGTAGSTADLWADIASATELVTGEFDLLLSVGGASATPRVEFDLPRVHMEVPAHGIEDVISLDTAFHALPTDISGTDEATIKYIAA